MSECLHKIDVFDVNGYSQYRCGLCGKYFEGMLAMIFLEINFPGAWKTEWLRLVQKRKEMNLERRRKK